MKREGFKPTIHSKICSEHFHQGDFIYNFGRKTLKHDSVPSIFNFPAHLLKKDPNERSKRLQTVSSKGVSSRYVSTKLIVTEKCIIKTKLIE